MDTVESKHVVVTLEPLTQSSDFVGGVVRVFLSQCDILAYQYVRPGAASGLSLCLVDVVRQGYRGVFCAIDFQVVDIQTVVI